MSKTRVIILICLLLVIIGGVITIYIDTESRLGHLIFGNPFIPALLFFVVFGAFAGILKIFVDLLLPNQTTVIDSGWEQTRANGKLSYVLRALLFCGIPVMIGLVIQFGILTDGSTYALRNFVGLILVLLGGVAAIANALWNYQESMYLKVKGKDQFRPM